MEIERGENKMAEKKKYKGGKAYEKKGVHGSPETAGADNLKNAKTLPKDKSGLMDKLLPVYKRKQEGKTYDGQWKDEQLMQSIGEMFDYCAENELKPTLPILQLWLGISRTQLWEWRNKPDKFGEKTNIVNNAVLIMEAFLQSNIDKYPTGSIFLLKTTHGHIETSKLDISNTSKDATQEEIEDQIKKLGLDKK